MTPKHISLVLSDGVELQSTSAAGVCRVKLIDENKRFDLTWDRFIRLHRAAREIKRLVPDSETILDVGGFDGALAMFLPGYKVDVVDPATTCGTVFSVNQNSYEAVVSIDAIEHVEPTDRKAFLTHMTQVAKRSCFINFPSRHTTDSQALVLGLTDNPLVKEHVEWQLPDTHEISRHLELQGYSVDIQNHGSLTQWLSQFVLQTVSPEKASRISRHLIENYLDEPLGAPLYHLVIGFKSSE